MYIKKNYLWCVLVLTAQIRRGETLPLRSLNDLNTETTLKSNEFETDMELIGDINLAIQLA